MSFGPKIHSIQFGRDNFKISTRYSDLKLIGRGSYGIVTSALDTKTGNRVAIKKITNIFEDEIKAKRILREIKLLLHFNSHENVVEILDMLTYPDSQVDFQDLYIVCTLMESDLDQIVSSPQPLSDQHNRYFLYQILRGLKYIHSANVVHRDLKPSNILVNANCDLALCDFGLSRGVCGEVDNCLTEYVVTRWYRAPELLCDSNKYGKAVDIWSIGCIFAEMITRGPFFQGKTPLHQLAMIVKVLGSPPVEELGFPVHQLAGRTIMDARKNNPKGLKRKLPENTSRKAFDLLSRMLVIKPEDRITVNEALQHPYLADLHAQMGVEPSCSEIFDSNFEERIKYTCSTQRLKELMHKEVQEFHFLQENSRISTITEMDITDASMNT